eukprot:5271817-Alexandrium_andersonii.AAC.1
MEGRRPPLLISGLRIAKCQDPEPSKGQAGLARQSRAGQTERAKPGMSPFQSTTAHSSSRNT